MKQCKWNMCIFWLHLLLLSLLKTAGAAVPVNTNHRRHSGHISRALQDAGGNVQARYLFMFSWSIEEYVETNIPSVEISCQDGAQAIVLEDENLDWSSCVASSQTALLCTLRTFVDTPTTQSLETISSSVTMACVGTPDAVSTVTASITESTYSYPGNPSVGSITRLIEATSICDVPETEGGSGVHFDLNFPMPFPVSPTGCSPEQSTTPFSPWCTFETSCLDDNGYVFGASCSEFIVPRATLQATMKDSDAIATCLFADSPAALPSLPVASPMTADYEVIVSYKESSCALSQESYIQATCENGGLLSVPTELTSCSRIDESTIRCPIPREPQGVLGVSFGSVASCTGSSLSELVLEVTWEPGNSGLNCVSDALSGSLSQIIELYQRCTTKSTELGPYADNVAVSCFPLSSSSPGAITVEDPDDDRVTVSPGSTSGYTYEVCSSSLIPACYPNCEDEVLSRLIAKIKPVHIDLDCLHSGEGTAAENVVDGLGGIGSVGIDEVQNGIFDLGDREYFEPQKSNNDEGHDNVNGAGAVGDGNTSGVKGKFKRVNSYLTVLIISFLCTL